MDADAIIKLAASTAKEEYLSGVTLFLSSAAAQEAIRGPSGGRSADSLLIEKNVVSRKIRLAGSGKDREPPPVRPREDGDHATLEWATSPGFDIVVTDDRHLLARLTATTDKASTLCESIVHLANAGIQRREKALLLLEKLSGRVRERERTEAIRSLGGSS
ncbi:MAG TPA: hypothetical protein VI893_03930 [Thermoplasmata archaeon]|nr:hypothetical protein [Thermoplasmata archaeon]